jgi:preprotein translocase subunit SecA
MAQLTPFQHAQQFFRPQTFHSGRSDQALPGLVTQRAESLRDQPDGRLPEEVDRLRVLVAGGQSVTDLRILVPAFAVLTEAIRRVHGLRLYDVQLLAGLALVRGAVAEMQTGEGKTLAAALPAFVHALRGRGVHVVTPNAYLAGRDWQSLAPVFERLGLRAGLLAESAPEQHKRAAYACDVTYGTGYEFGFDYLRDQLRLMKQARRALGEQHRQRLRGCPPPDAVGVQRGHAVAIIDEIDSVLIDEACVPLVLSGDADDERDSSALVEAGRLAERLESGRHFLVHASRRQLSLTDDGLSVIHQHFGPQPDWSLERPWWVYVQQALYARWLLRKDVDYIVRDQKILLVDGFTGRIFGDRMLRDGLPVTAERTTAARISRQRYFRLYETICGMTGTASGSERELWLMYGLPVVMVPRRAPSQRTLLPTRFFTTAAAKWEAIEQEVLRLHATGRPLLIGSRTIENSELLAKRLAGRGISFRLLNGKQDEDEAAVIAQAGQLGAITIATNMAGRGTDIRLGPGAAEIGGLHLIGVEQHEAARIDRQLQGRVARQEEPGSCQFFVSADDALLRDHAPALAEQLRSAGDAQGHVRRDFSAAIARLQRHVEAAAYGARRRLLAYDNWLDEVLAQLARTD